MRKPVSRSFTFLVVSVALICTTADAQTSSSDPVEIVQQRASAVVSTIMRASADRTQRFNAEMTAINLLRPLDPDRLDQESIQQSKQKISAFLDFLGGYRDSSDILEKLLEDSVTALRADMPRMYQETFMSKFLTAYQADLKAFDDYTLAISGLHKEVVGLLSFIQRSKYQIKNGQLQFLNGDDFKKYQELMKTLQARNNDLTKANQLPRETSKDLQKALDSLFQNPGE